MKIRIASRKCYSVFSHRHKCLSCLVHTVSNTVYIRFEVFTAVTMKKAVFWDVAPCRSGVNRRFGGDQSAFNVSDGRFACGFSYFPL
jgi:hypothetical protein